MFTQISISNLFFRVLGALEAEVPDFFEEILTFGIGSIVLGFIQMFFGYIFVACFNYAAQGQVRIQIQALMMMPALFIFFFQFFVLEKESKPCVLGTKPDSICWFTPAHYPQHPRLEYQNI